LQLHGNIFRIFSSYRGSSGTEFSRVVDPYSFFPDPDPIRLQDFNDQKLKKNQLIFFLSITAMYLLDPDPDSEYGSGSTDPIEYGSNTDPDPGSGSAIMCATKNKTSKCPG
jgi:hypothetical protein